MPGGNCSRCQCNNNSDLCNTTTGECLNCQYNTTGFHCERCENGTWGNATAQQCQGKVLEKRVSYLNGRILLDNKLMWEVSTANCSMMCIYSIISHCAYTHKFKPVWIYATAARIHLRLQLVPHCVAKTFPLVFSDFETPVVYTWRWINFLAQGYECEFNQSYILTYGSNKKSSPAIFTSECLLNANAN